MEFPDKEETIPQFFQQSAATSERKSVNTVQQRKERLKISNITKFESDLLKTEKDIIPQSRRIFLQMLV